MNLRATWQHSRVFSTKWLLAGGGLLAAALVLYLLSARLNGAPQFVTQPVTRGAVTQSVTATGYVNPVLTITVGTYVSGVIQSIYCDYNTHVHKGQLCAKIDPRPYQAVVDQDSAGLATARAQLLKDQANLDYARIARDRYIKLFADKATSRDSLDAAQNNFAQASAQVALDRASVAQHEAALNEALVNLGYTDIVSPVDGTVVSRNVTMGQTVAASFQTPTLFLIATDLARMQVDTNVSESDIGGLRIGDRALFTVEAFPDRTFQGAVTQVRQAPQTVQNVVTYDVVITVANPEFLLKPGMTATVRIIALERRNVLRVPNQALRYSPGGLAAAGAAGPAHVWVLRDRKPEQVVVQTGLVDDNFTEVTGGDLHPDDRVVVSEQGVAAKTQASAPVPRF
ncbi:MAG TPA: efflux RND transporter periplasmic adaptor subunit [Rhizomicrobium sp.]|nr:efflux RND transporter periplasmic adaptor subunit [Rhizomicrobium sp.]